MELIQLRLRIIVSRSSIVFQCKKVQFSICGVRVDAVRCSMTDKLALYSFLDRLADFVFEHQFLFHAHSSNYFIDQLFRFIDHDWIAFLSRLPFATLDLLTIDASSIITNASCPQSLRVFMSSCQSLLPSSSSLLPFSLNVTQSYLKPELASSLKSKKRHECQRMAHLVSCLAKQLGEQRIVDIGAGQTFSNDWF